MIRGDKGQGMIRGDKGQALDTKMQHLRLRLKWRILSRQALMRAAAGVLAVAVGLGTALWICHVTAKQVYGAAAWEISGQGDVLCGIAQRQLLSKALRQCLILPEGWLTSQFSSFDGQIATPKAATMDINNHDAILTPIETFKKSEAMLPANQRGRIPPIKVWDTNCRLSKLQKFDFFIRAYQTIKTNFLYKDYITPFSPSQAKNLTTNILWNKIVSIEYADLKHVWDIKVDGTHTYVRRVRRGTREDASGSRPALGGAQAQTKVCGYRRWHSRA